MDVVVNGEPLNQAAQADERKTFRLRQGKGLTHFHEGRNLKPGDEVELTPSQALAFADKFEPVEDSSSRRKSKDKDEDPAKTFEPSEEDKKAQAVRPVPTSHTPQDIGAKTFQEGTPAQNIGNATRLRQPAATAAPVPAGADGDVDGIPPIRDNKVATNKTGGPPDPAVTKQPSEKDAAKDDKK